MDHLFATHNHLVLTQIFLSLDGADLKNARLVSKEWNGFIVDYLWKCKFNRY